MNLKKLISTLLLLLTVNLFAQTREDLSPAEQNISQDESSSSATMVSKKAVNFFSPDMNWKIHGGISLYNENIWVPVEQFLDVDLSLDMKEFSASFGICHEQSADHLVNEMRWGPTFFNHFNFGIMTTFHLFTYKDVFTETDTLAGVFFKYDTNSWFNVTAKAAYMFKASRIFSIEDSVSWLYNHSVAVALDLDFKINRFVNPYFEFNSYTKYDYNLWFTPQFIFGIRTNPTKNFTIGAEIDLVYIDFFTLSGYLNSIYERAYVEFKL